MKIHNLQLNQFSLVALATSFMLACAGCSGGGSSSTTSTADPKVSERPLSLGSAEDPNAFTVVVGVPYVTKNLLAPLYDDLFTNLTTSSQQGKLSVSRILLTIQNPGNVGNIFNGTFQIGDSFTLSDANNGQVIAFLKKLSDYNAIAQIPIEVYAYPDVEKSSQWEFWNTPKNAPSVVSCSAALNQPNPAMKAMQNSICWASLVNKLVNGSSPVIKGVAYDSQSNYLTKYQPSDFNAPQWMYSQTHADIYSGAELKFGWITGKGVAASNPRSVDLNLIEVYDLDSNANPAYDALTASSSGNLIEPQLPTCTGILCAYNFGNAYPTILSGNGVTSADKNVALAMPVYKKFFPGTQYAINYPPLIPGTSNPNPNFIPVIGSNIYQCALNSGSSAYGCNEEYSNNVDTSAKFDQQILQAMNYIWTGNPKQAPTKPYYGNGSASLDGTVVFLFSTQYAGPVKSYSDFVKPTPTTSSSLCIDPTTPAANQCQCMASKYDPIASCGDENSFGSWGNNFTDFKNFVFGPSGFMSSQGGGNCPGNSCSPGLYMYDFIPQAWYSQ